MSLLSFLCLLFLTVATAFPLAGRYELIQPTTRNTPSVTPVVSGTPEVLGLASDPSLSRDSCTSTHVHNRELWTCRDTSGPDFFYSSTASWSDFSSDHTPKISNGNLTLYGNNTGPYFPPQANECGGGWGSCGDGSRWAIWPDTRPLAVDIDSKISLYTWIKNVHLGPDWEQLTPQPSTSLFRSDYQPDAPLDILPPVALVDEEFWPSGVVAYGDYGFLHHNHTAYLYGALNGTLGRALAKVPVDSIEDKTKYSYYTSSGWSSNVPSNLDASAGIPNAGTGGQGTFYYSAYFSSFVWIGGAWGVGGDFYIATAPEPEGPWTEPKLFYSAEVGTQGLKAYSEQAHPGLSLDHGNGKDIYLSYTKVDAQYSTPLIRVVWE